MKRKQSDVPTSGRQFYRSTSCRLDILQGQDVLECAQKGARRLYNLTRYCAVSFNRKLARARGHSSLAGKLPKYPRFAGMWKALHDTDEYRALNDRLATYVLRGFDTSMRSWFSNLKSNPKARPPRYAETAPPLVFEIGQNARLYADGIVRLTALPGTVENRHIYARLYLPPLTCPERVKNIKILSDGRCIVTYKLDAKPSPGNGVAAIDLGIKRIATLAFQSGESIMYTGASLLSSQRYFQKKIARCKPSGWRGKGDGRKLPKSKRLHAYYKQWKKQKAVILHAVTASIIEECVKRGVGVIVIGNLKNIKQDENGNGKDFGKRINQQLHAWPFARITQMIMYKAEERGIKVVKISERDTSKTCCMCGNVCKSARVKRGLYVCKVCGLSIHADVNGAFNILKKYLPALQLGVAGGFPAQPSQAAPTSGPGKSPSQIEPTFVAKCDLQTGAVRLALTGSGAVSTAAVEAISSRIRLTEM